MRYKMRPTLSQKKETNKEQIKWKAGRGIMENFFKNETNRRRRGAIKKEQRGVRNVIKSVGNFMIENKILLDFG